MTEARSQDPVQQEVGSSEHSTTSVQPGSPPQEALAPGRRALKIAGRVTLYAAVVLLVLGVLGVLTVVFVIRHYEARVPNVEQLRAGYAPPQVTRVLTRDGTLLANLFTERRTVISLKELPDHAKLAFLAAEDAHFYEHQGLNYWGMLRALYVNLRKGTTRQGGSTITQQVVKNILLDAERSYERKIKEAILARRLEQNLSKDEIYSLYLNQIYFGHSRHGVEEAARYYFGKRAAELDLAEAALLAGLVAAPERYTPRRAPAAALERRRYVLQQMLDKGFITPALFQQAVDAPLRLAPAVEAEAELAPEAVAHARRVLREVAGERAKVGGFTVTTTIDPALQAKARQILRHNLEEYARRQKLAPPYTLHKRRLWGAPFQGSPRPNHAYTGVVASLDDAAGTFDVTVGDLTGRVHLADEERFNQGRLAPSKFTEVGAAMRVQVMPPSENESQRRLRLALGPQSALVLIDVRTREVRALVGSYEGLVGGLDRATRARRQPGSSFKPFVYGYALYSRRFSPASVLELPGHTSEGSDGPEAKRMLSVRQAIARSDNAAALKLIDEVGAAQVVEWARACGIESELRPTPSLALGAYEVTPLEIANAYATFASGGEYAPPRLLLRIEGPGKAEVKLPPEPPRRRVMSHEEAYMVTSLLRTVVESGTGRRARALGRPVAGKTGTTNEAKDAWFVGYSPEYVAAVWVGYDSPMGLGAGEQGAVTALPAWIELMKTAHQGRPPTPFPRPSKIVAVAIDPATGLLPYEGQDDAIEEIFLPDGVPSERAQAGDENEESAEQASSTTGAPEGPSTRRAAGGAAPIDEQPPPF